MTTHGHTPGISEKVGQRNNNRDAKEPIRRVDGDEGRTNSNSPMRQNHQRNNNKSRSPMRNNKSRSPMRNNKSRSPTRRHYNNNSKSPIRRKNSKDSADMTVIVNRCDLWDSAAHFQPDECFQLQNQYPVARVLPYQFSNDDTTTPPPPTTLASNEVIQVAPSHAHPSIAVARVPHRVESVEFPVKKHDECERDQHHCNVIDTSTPNPHDPNVVHDKYWCQRR